MTYSPYTPGELTELRQTAVDVQRAAPGVQTWPIVHKLIATITDIEADRDAAKADLEKLREAARALLDSLPSDMSTCPICRDDVLATKVCRVDTTTAAWFACDKHAPPGSEDKRSAPALRTLRALLGVEP